MLPEGALWCQLTEWESALVKGWQKPAMWSELHELTSTPLLVMVSISTGVRAEVRIPCLPKALSLPPLLWS